MAGIRSFISPNQKIGLMGHIIADFPNRELAFGAIATMAGRGVTVIEIQIPFSEPMADGPVFMAANHKALDEGIRVADSFALMKLVSEKYPQIDFVFMTYLNIVFKMGYEVFVDKAALAGAKGLIIPDLPVEYSEPLDVLCEKSGLTNVRLIAPNTTESRMSKILKNAKGLIYIVARKGVTGSETEFSNDLKQMISKVRKLTTQPLAVGFGVRNADDIVSLTGLADFAIIGTKAFQVLEESGIKGLEKFWQEIQSAAQK